MTAPDDRQDGPPTPEEEAVERRLLDIAANMEADLRVAGELSEVRGADKVRETLERLWTEGGSAEGDGPASEGASDSPGPSPGPRERAGPGGAATSRGAPAAGRPTRRLWTALAAASLLIVVARLLSTGDEPAPSILLGEDGLAIIAHASEVDAYEEVRWVYPAPDNVEFEVVVHNGGSGSGRTVHARSGKLKAVTSWRFPDAAANWPDPLVVEVTAYDLDGEVVDADRVDLELR